MQNMFCDAKDFATLITTATVPAGTSFPAVLREPSDLLMRYAAAFFIDQLNSVPSTHMRLQSDRSGRASIRILARKKVRAPSQRIHTSNPSIRA